MKELNTLLKILIRTFSGHGKGLNESFTQCFKIPALIKLLQL